MSLKRNNVHIHGAGPRTIVMAHGFGCDQNMWRFLLPHFLQDYRVVLFDYTGCGKSDATRFDVKRYSQLSGYAEDVLEILAELDLYETIFVGHSVSAMIGLIASLRKPARFSKLVMVNPSPCFMNLAPDNHGGFERADLEELLLTMDKNYIGWAQNLGALVVGLSNGDHLAAELSGSFCSTDPVIAKTFARATFFSDHRDLLPMAGHPTLILQSQSDALADVTVGQYIHQHTPGSRMEIVQAEGHCLHMTHPVETAGFIHAFLRPAAEVAR